MPSKTATLTIHSKPAPHAQPSAHSSQKISRSSSLNHPRTLPAAVFCWFRAHRADPYSDHANASYSLSKTLSLTSSRPTSASCLSLLVITDRRTNNRSRGHRSPHPASLVWGHQPERCHGAHPPAQAITARSSLSAAVIYGHVPEIATKKGVVRGAFSWLVVRCLRWFSTRSRPSSYRPSPTHDHCRIRSCSVLRSFWPAALERPIQRFPSGWA